MQSLLYYLKKPYEALDRLLIRYGGRIPDAQYLKCRFYLRMGYRLNLKDPQTFSEKLQWLKLFDRRPIYTTMVDKYAVKKYVADVIGDEYIIPTIGVWDSPDEIDWNSLPEQFVLKCTHDSGGLVICRDKSKLDINTAKEKLRRSLTFDYYKSGREWPYKNVPRKIIAENFLDPTPITDGLPSYIWYCFNGKPKYCQVIHNRTAREQVGLFDTGWNHLKINGFDHNEIDSEVLSLPPDDLELQIRIARELSKNEPYSRIDLFHTEENTYYGEITHYPANGFSSLPPEQNDRILGQMLHLPGIQSGGVICEILDNEELQITHPDLADYKFFCFDGVPRYCQVITGRGKKMCIDFFDKEWNHQPFHEPKRFPFAEKKIKKPLNLDEMWNLAAKLSENKSFSRIDFYEIKCKVYFGEITFFPTSGMGGFMPSEYDLIFGNLLTLNKLTQ